MAIFPHWLVLPHMFFFLTWCGNAEANKCTFPIENILRLLCMPLKLEKVFFFIKRLQFAFANKSWAEYLKTDGNKWQRRLKIKFIFFRKSVQLEICSNRKNFSHYYICANNDNELGRRTQTDSVWFTHNLGFPFLQLDYYGCCLLFAVTS